MKFDTICDPMLFLMFSAASTLGLGLSREIGEKRVEISAKN